MTCISSRLIAAAALLLPLLADAAPPAGQIVIDADHPAWFKYHGGGPFYMCGPGDPEGFLYRGTRNPDGTRDGDQMALISKVAGTGANCIYLMALRSHGGDGGSTENPYVNSDVSEGIATAILDQWELWFTAMDENGITIYFIFYDDDAKPFGKELPPSGQLSAEETVLIDTLVARFKHHRRLIWCIAEEYGEGLTKPHAARIAERIAQQDDRQHPVAIHQNSATTFDFKGNALFHQFAVQWNVATPAELHAGTLAAWNDVGGAVNINMSEFADAGTGADLRRKLWAIAMAGGYSMVLGMDIASTSSADLQACGHLVRFMEATRFNLASPHDELARSDTDYVMATPGDIYIAYGDSGNSLGLSLVGGQYKTRWYNPADGMWTDAGVLSLAPGTRHFTKPGSFGAESVLYLEGPQPPRPASEPSPADGAINVAINPGLSWQGGLEAASHDVFFGTSSPGAFQSNQLLTSFTPPSLRPDTTYYWRVDEVNSHGTTTGLVWMFTTVALPIDSNRDGDVDQEDFGRFQVCLTGGGASISPECDFANLNHDDAVDVADFVIFFGCLSGPGVPADGSCIE